MSPMQGNSLDNYKIEHYIYKAMNTSYSIEQNEQTEADDEYEDNWYFVWAYCTSAMAYR